DGAPGPPASLLCPRDGPPGGAHHPAGRLAVAASRAAHLALAADRQAAALAVGYVRGLRPVRRTTVTVANAGNGRPVDGHAEDADDADGAPVFVIEAMLRLVAAAGDEVTLEEIVE